MQRFKKYYPFVLFVCFVCLVPSVSWSTTIVRLSEAQLVERSTLVVRGRVLHQQSKWNRGRLAIITQVTIHVDEELLKRKAPNQVIVRYYGGTVGSQTMGLPGGPHFANNQEVVLFLHSNKFLPGEYLLTGWTQGIWKMSHPKASFPKDTPAGHRAFVSQQGAHISIKKHGSHTHLRVAPSTLKLQQPLYLKIKQWRKYGKQVLLKKTAKPLFKPKRSIIKLRKPTKLFKLLHPKILKPARH